MIIINWKRKIINSAWKNFCNYCLEKANINILIILSQIKCYKNFQFNLTIFKNFNYKLKFCRRGAARGARHKTLNEIVRDALNEAGQVSILEPPGLSRTDGKRPDGVTVMPFERGLPMAWDVTVVHTCASSYLRVSTYENGAAAAAAEIKKERKYEPIKERAIFRAIGIETIGAFGPSSRKLFDEVAAMIKARTGDTRSRSRLYCRIAAAVQCGNAACIAESHSNSSSPRLPTRDHSDIFNSCGPRRRAAR